MTDVAEQPNDAVAGLSDEADDAAGLSDDPVGLSDDAVGLSDDASESSTGLPGLRRIAVVMGSVALAVLALDLITKQLVLSNLTEGEPKTLIPGVLYVDLIRNGGAAFSLGTNYTWIFPTITVVVIVAILRMARGVRSVGWAVGFGLVLGGAFGNLADRLFRAPGPMRGQVVDFASLFSKDGAGFAIFNLADSALSCGVALLILLELWGRHRDGTRHAPAWRPQPEVRD